MGEKKLRDIHLHNEASNDQDINRLDQNSLDLVFLKSRSYKAFQNKKISNALLKEIYALVKWSPTCYNGNHMRLIFVKSIAQKKRLASACVELNKMKIINAPVTAIIAYDMKFYEKFDALLKGGFAEKVKAFKELYVENDTLTYEDAFRNSSIQGAFFIMATRGLGLDCCPMSGFSNESVDKLFLKGTNFKSNFLCGIGYGDEAALPSRNPRLSFDVACKIV